MRIRPCIDLHEGRVKQIVGSTLKTEALSEMKTNFETDQTSAYYAAMYRRDGLPGGHVVMLGPECEEAALLALRTYPNGLQVGGGINADNAKKYIDAGASHIIVTSAVFRDGYIDYDALRAIQAAVGKDKIVLDLSCRKRKQTSAEHHRYDDDNQFYVVTNKWQAYTNFAVTQESLKLLAKECSEFLVHAVDVEGKRCGILEDLVEILSCSPIPITYAGGVRCLKDLELIDMLGRGRVHATIGSALDIFNGTLPYSDVVKWQRAREIRRLRGKSKKTFMKPLSIFSFQNF